MSLHGIGYLSTGHQPQNCIYPYITSPPVVANTMTPAYPLQHQIPSIMVSPYHNSRAVYHVSPTSHFTKTISHPQKFHHQYYEENNNFSPGPSYMFQRDGSSVCSSMTDSHSFSSLPEVVELPKCNLIVNYIPPELSETEFTRMFQTFGTLISVKMIRDPKTHQSMGYGFVQFTRPECAQRAIQALNGLKIGAKEIKVSYARPSSKDIKDANLYVSNLPVSVKTTSQLEEIFSPYGEIITSRLLLDHNLKPRGVGFVRFNLRQEASLAMTALNGIVLEGSGAPLMVKFAKSTSRCHWDIQPFTPRPVQQQHNNVVYVTNLDSSVNESTLMTVFGRFGVIQDISVINNHWSNKKNYAFVTMLNFSSAQAAINQLNGKTIGTKKIHVSFKHTGVRM